MDSWTNYLADLNLLFLGKYFAAWGATIVSVIVLNELIDFIIARFKKGKVRRIT